MTSLKDNGTKSPFTDDDSGDMVESLKRGFWRSNMSRYGRIQQEEPFDTKDAVFTVTYRSTETNKAKQS